MQIKISNFEICVVLLNSNNRIVYYRLKKTASFSKKNMIKQKSFMFAINKMEYVIAQEKLGSIPIRNDLKSG